MSYWSGMSRFGVRRRSFRAAFGTAAAILIVVSVSACGGGDPASGLPTTAEARTRLTERGIVDASGAASIYKAATIIHNATADDATLTAQGLTHDEFQQLKLDFCTYVWGEGSDIGTSLGLGKLYPAPFGIDAYSVGAEDGIDLEAYCTFYDTVGGGNSKRSLELAVSTAEHEPSVSNPSPVRYSEELSGLTVTISSDPGSPVDSSKLASFAADARTRMVAGKDVQDSTSPTPATSSQSSPPPVATSSAPPTATTLGTVVQSSDGESVTTTWAVEPARLGTNSDVPQAVLNACLWGAPDTMVWIHGSVTVTYQGSISQKINFDQPQVSLITDGSVPAMGGQMVIHAPLNDDWNGCIPPGGSSADNAWSYTFPPGGSDTYELWAGFKLISNTNPALTPEQTNAMQITDAAFATDQFTSATTSTWTGPHAANCDDRNQNRQGRVLLYATPPATYVDIYGHSVSCIAAGG